MTFWYDGVKSDTLGLYLSKNTLAGLPELDDQSITSNDIEGEIYLASEFRARSFNLPCYIVGDSPEDYLIKLGQVASMFRDRTLKPLILEEDETKRIMCLMVGGIKPKLEVHGAQLELEMVAPDPFWYAITASSASISTIGNVTSLGNRETFPVYGITGPAISPSITVNGVQMTYSGILTGLDVLTIDTATRTIKFNNSNADNYFNHKFLPLVPGVNTVAISAGSLNILWRDCWL